MDFKSSNAVKVLIKRSDRLCLLYVLILGGFGIPFFIICVNQCLTNFSARFVVSGLIGLGFIIGAGILGKKLVTKDYGTGISDYFADHPETDIAELDRDFAEAEHIVKNLWIGDKCTYHMGYLYPYIIENKDLIWVYLTHTSGKQSHWDVNFCDKNH